MVAPEVRDGMRTFVLVGHTATLDPDFSLEDLPGAGRLDVLCRNVTASLLLSHGIREDVTAWAVIQDDLTVEFQGEAIRHLRPDERSTAALFREALAVGADRAVSPRPIESTPGVYVRRQGLADTLETTSGTPVRLDREGTPLRVDDVPDDPVFVLSDHQSFSDAERALLDEVGASARSLGPRALHGDQAIAIAHNRCDRAGTT